MGKAQDNNVEVAVPEDEKDINAAYEDALAVINRCVLSTATPNNRESHTLFSKPPKIDEKPKASQKQEDYYRQFRTK